MTEPEEPARPLAGLDNPFQRLVESVHDYAIFLLDADGRVASWNPGAERLKGYAAHEILGKHFSIFYPEEAKARGWPQQELVMAAAQGRFEDEGLRVRKDWTTFWANVVITAIKDRDGTLRGFAKITRDLTERRRQEELLRQSEARFRTLVDAVKDYAIFMLDPEGRVVSWNSGAERINGYSRDEILGRHFSLLYPEEGRQRRWPEQELETAARTGRFEDEGLRVRKDGTTFRANVVLTAIRDADGTLQGFAKVTRDLTDRRRVEALEKAEKQTNEFLAMLAHELRNPLAPIRNALHLLTRKPTTDPTELWVRDVLQRQTVQMTRLVDDLLDVSRITRSTVALSRARVDLRRSIREAADASAQWIQSRGHELVIELPEEPLETEADPVRLSQVIQNLLHNAAKFTPNGGRIVVRAGRSGEHVTFSVEDTGIGMSPELVRTAFELFKQGQQSIDRPEGGLGVGLTLVERLVTLHGGSIEAASEGPGQGSKFSVRLPAYAGSEPAEADAEGADEGSARRLRIVIVDDNADAANALRYLLENEGHEIRVATNGPAGLAAAREFRPEALLLDIGLPELNGYEIARQVRADSKLPRMTIIAITGYGQPQDRARTAAAGFDHHLTKPVEFSALRRLLRAVASQPLASPGG
ncbi:MAG: PAS domain S-box protein [Betaproteobacteria bacterium]|nr:PAS domain S-box protein [Betaproteobacteria bacterium]